MQTITSKHEPAEIKAQVQSDVIVNGKVAVKSGAIAGIKIVEVRKSRCWGNPGYMTLGNGYITDVNGKKQKVLYSYRFTGEEKTWPKVMGGISIFFLFPLALCGFVHGGEAVVSGDFDIEVITAADFSV